MYRYNETYACYINRSKPCGGFCTADCSYETPAADSFVTCQFVIHAFVL